MKDMILRITYSAIFIKGYFKVCFGYNHNLLLIFFFPLIMLVYFSSLQNSSFSFNSCLPSGWIFLLLSGVLTLISERLFMDQQNFWSTFSLHFSIGLACFLVSLCIMWVIFFKRLNWSFFCFNSLVPLYKFYFCFFS